MTKPDYSPCQRIPMTSVVKTDQTKKIKTDRKWKVVEATDPAKKCLKIKEVNGKTQTNRNGLV